MFFATSPRAITMRGLSGQAPFYHQWLRRNGLSPHCPHIKYFDPLRGVRPHDQRARDAAPHRESTAIYRCFRKGAMSNTRAFGERNHATSKTAFRAYQIRPFFGLSTHCPHIKYFASLPRVRPHEQRAGDAALHRSAVAIYRCFRRGVTPNTRAPG